METIILKLIEFLNTRIIASWKSTIFGTLIILFALYMYYTKALEITAFIIVLLIGLLFLVLNEKVRIVKNKDSNKDNNNTI